VLFVDAHYLKGLPLFEAMGWLGILKLYDKYKINVQFV
jgi:hypothetical protein